MSNNFVGNMASLYANTARARATGFNKSFPGFQSKKNTQVKWPDKSQMVLQEPKEDEILSVQTEKQKSMRKCEKDSSYVKYGQSRQSGSQNEDKRKTQPVEEQQSKNGQNLNRGRMQSALAKTEKEGQRATASKDNDFLSQRELQRAVAMSVILGPPASRKRNRYEGITGRR